MNNDYTSRQSARDRNYAHDYDAWVKSLTPEERAKLASLGVDKPDVPRDGGGFSHDAADLPEVSYVPDIAAEIDQPTASPTAPTDTGELRADTLASFCARIRSAKNPLLVFDAICFATGVLALDGASQTELAKRHGVSRAAFSKIATQWCKTFGIKPSRGMKSEHARDAYKHRAQADWQRRSKPKLTPASPVDAQSES
jgi:hypothetical protein